MCSVLQDGRAVSPLTLGRISSYYYITHNTVRMFQNELRADSSIPELIEIISVRANVMCSLPCRMVGL